MRNMIWIGSQWAAPLILAALSLLLALPVRSQMWLYPLARQAAQMRLDYKTRAMTSQETSHFIIKYTSSDADVAPLVAETAEAAYQSVTGILGYAPAGKTLVLIYPDQEGMKQVFGWGGGSANAMGAYWGGVIEVLSPRAMAESYGAANEIPPAAEFARSGPMVHEFTHLVLDHMTRGNYSRWFTEGLAQYLEYRVNGYQWCTAGNDLTKGNLYTMGQLDRDFDSLAKPDLAYRQSLAAIRYLVEKFGSSALDQVIDRLKRGIPLEQAISRTTGMEYADFGRAVNAWASHNMPHPGADFIR